MVSCVEALICGALKTIEFKGAYGNVVKIIEPG